MPRLKLSILATLTLVLLALASDRSEAAVISISNLGDKPVQFELSHPVAKGSEPLRIQLAANMTGTYVVGREPEIGFFLNGKPTRYRLDPYSAYYFAKVEQQEIFSGIELVAPMPSVTDVPVEKPASPILLTIPVEVYVEDTDRRRPEIAVADYRKRVEAASQILQSQIGVKLQVVDSGSYKHDPESEELTSHLSQLERSVKAKPGRLIIGFSNRRFPPPKANEPKELNPIIHSVIRGPFARHLIVCDTNLRSEADRIEVLIQAIGRKLGAVGTPDYRSVMRKNIGNGQALFNKVPTQFDPLNGIITSIWAKRFQEGNFNDWTDFTKPERDRLMVLYRTLNRIGSEDADALNYVLKLEDSVPEVVINEPRNLPTTAKPTLPKETKIESIPESKPTKKAEIENKNNGPMVVIEPTKPVLPEPKTEPMPVIAPPMIEPVLNPNDPNLTEKQNASRNVVVAIARRAKELQMLSVSERPKADALTAEYVRTAANVASSLDEKVQVYAFLVGLGIALDDSNTLVNNALTSRLVEKLESKEESKGRLEALGVPTVRGRPDLAKHFFISAALTELIGPAAAEAAGITKELLDLETNSGFSFQDLAADLAGIEFAKTIQAQPGLLKQLAQSFQVQDFVPELTGLREGLSARRFKQTYGSVDDPRFLEVLANIRDRIKALK